MRVINLQHIQKELWKNSPAMLAIQRKTDRAIYGLLMDKDMRDWRGRVEWTAKTYC